MKNISSIILSTAMLFTACENKAQTMDSTNFKAKKVSRTATITVNGKIENVFPLFGAFEERKWADGWSPKLIYPDTEIIEEGTTFKTRGHGHDEKEFIWRVSKYEADKFMIQYLVSSENRYWTITVKCDRLNTNHTSAKVTYTFIGLNELGNNINEHSIQVMYKYNLKDWEEAINYYLVNGKVKLDE
jgi:hypothetical protein